jgi:hypothetical protein
MAKTSTKTKHQRRGQASKRKSRKQPTNRTRGKNARSPSGRPRLAPVVRRIRIRFDPNVVHPLTGKQQGEFQVTPRTVRVVRRRGDHRIEFHNETDVAVLVVFRAPVAARSILQISPGAKDDTTKIRRTHPAGHFPFRVSGGLQPPSKASAFDSPADGGAQLSIGPEGGDPEIIIE